MGLSQPRQGGQGQMEKQGTLLEKLARVTKNLKYVQKDGWNAHHKYKFVANEDLVNSLRVELSKEGIFFSPSIINVHQESKGKFVHTVVQMLMRFFDGDTNESIESQWYGESFDSQDKGLNKAITAATKYFLMKTFLVPVGDEPDSDNETYDEPEAKVQDAVKKVEEKFEKPEKKKERDYTILPNLSGSSDGKSMSSVGDGVLKEYENLITAAKEKYKDSKPVILSLDCYLEEIHQEQNRREQV